MSTMTRDVSRNYIQLPEFKKMTNNLKKTLKYERNKLMIHILYFAGLRSQELVELTPRMHIYDEKVLTITGKGDKDRDVIIPIGLNDYIQDYQKKELVKLDQPFFNRTVDSQSSLISITTKAIRKLLKVHNLPNPHFFRHSFAVNTIKRTRNIKFLQDQLGHSNIQTTMVYLKFISYEEETKAMDEFYESSEMS